MFWKKKITEKTNNSCLHDRLNMFVKKDDEVFERMEVEIEQLKDRFNDLLHIHSHSGLIDLIDNLSVDLYSTPRSPISAGISYGEGD